MTVDALTKPFLDVVVGTGTVRIFLPSSFRTVGTGGLKNVPNRVVQFSEGVVPNSTSTLLAQSGSGSFGIWVLPITGHKFVSGTVRTATVFEPLNMSAITMVQATYNTVIETLQRASSYAAALSAVKALTPYDPSVHTNNQPAGSLRPITVAYIVEMTGTNERLNQFMLQAYSTTAIRD